MAASDANTYAWLGVVIFMVFVRFASRIIQVRSPKNLQLEDALMVFVTICYVLLTVATVIIGHYGTNGIPLDQKPDWDAATIRNRITGSKWVMVSEQMWLAVIWGCKACLLLLYNNMTMGLTQQRLVLVIGIFCALSYVVIQILFFGVWCRPFHDYWAFPPTSKQCSVFTNHLILVLALNVSSDVVMMAVPLPLLIRAQLSLYKKLTLCAVFSLGIFVIVCCCLSKYYSIHNPYGSEWIDWYLREAGTAVIVANIPQTWPLMRRLFHARSFFSTRMYSRERNGYRTGSSTVHLSTMLRSQKRSAVDRESDEFMARNTDPLQIWEHKQFQVTEAEADADSRAESSRRSASLTKTVVTSIP